MTHIICTAVGPYWQRYFGPKVELDGTTPDQTNRVKIQNFQKEFLSVP